MSQRRVEPNFVIRAGGLRRPDIAAENQSVDVVFESKAAGPLEALSGTIQIVTDPETTPGLEVPWSALVTGSDTHPPVVPR